jgi:hypothetical protein
MAKREREESEGGAEGSEQPEDGSTKALSKNKKVRMRAFGCLGSAVEYVSENLDWLPTVMNAASQGQAMGP